MGIVKVDLLGLGMMAAIQDALALVNGTTDRAGRTCWDEACAEGAQRPELDLAHLPENDPAVYKLLQEADTIGVFQVESRAQMATLPRLKPTCFYDLVVEVAIIRPGPDRRADGASLSESPRRARAGAFRSTRRSSRCSRGRSACRCSRSSCSGWRWWPQGSPAGRPRNCGARWASSAPSGGCSRSKVQLREGMARNGITGETAERDHHVDHLVRAVRVSRIARRELRAARVRERVSQGALPGGVLHRAPQQPADGVLSPVDARQGRAAPRRPVSADRRADVRLGLHGRTGRIDSTGAAIRQRPAAGGGREKGSRAPAGRPAAGRDDREPGRPGAGGAGLSRNAGATMSRCSSR